MTDTNGMTCGTCGWPADAECECTSPETRTAELRRIMTQVETVRLQVVFAACAWVAGNISDGQLSLTVAKYRKTVKQYEKEQAPNGLA